MNFLFGVGTAGHQVEGNNVNSDWWAFEQTDRHPAEPSGDAIDHYHLYPSDIRQIAELGFNTYRFSVEWSRLEPEPGFYSAAAFRHYRRMLACCMENRLVPVVTINHFSSPRWIAEQGGWEVRQTAEHFARLCEQVAEHLGDLIPVACTLNEINMPELIAIDGGLSDFSEENVTQAPFPFCEAKAASETTLLAHRLGAEALKSRCPEMQVGLTLHMHDFVSKGAPDALVEEIRQRAEGRFLEATRNDDFIGVQIYGNKYIGPTGPVPFEEDGQKFPRDNSPAAVVGAIRYASKFAKKIFITENGYTESRDARKREHITQALDGVRQCMDEGIDVMGYIYWSGFDIYEWMRGFEADYGLINVDRNTQQRTVSPTAKWLGELASRWAPSRR